MILFLLILVLLLAEPTPVFKGCALSARFMFHFHHANIFHLLANAVCFYSMRKIRWAEAYVIAVACSFFVVHPTVGLSGLLFAAAGINMGKQGNGKGASVCLLSALLCGLLPGVSLVLHVSSFLTGFAYGWCIETYRIYRRCFPA